MTQRDAIVAKISNIKSCLTMIKKVTDLKPASLEDPIKQDLFVLNLQRAVQSAIDMANLIIADKGYELPRSYAHSFAILCNNEIIDSELKVKMSKMAGFRNIAVHDYTNLNPEILKSIMTNHLVDLETYYSQVYKFYRV